MSQYDDLCCNTMEKALAELLGISIDTIDMLGLTIEPDVGHDDFFMVITLNSLLKNLLIKTYCLK